MAISMCLWFDATPPWPAKCTIWERKHGKEAADTPGGAAKEAPPHL